MKVLSTWLGNTDIYESSKHQTGNHGVGPIAQAITEMDFDLLFLLANQSRDETKKYKDWIQNQYNIAVTCHHIDLTDPTDYRAIYVGCTLAIDNLLDQLPSEVPVELTFHISPGTPAMQTIWVLLANTRYEATLIQTAREFTGVKIPEIPFEIAAQFIPKVLENADNKLVTSAGEIPKEGAHFGNIIYRSQEMAHAISLAKKAATRNLPILIQGESGTGKELFARAIHSASPRSEKPFKVINCGAIPRELLESMLFGHTKGSFTGAFSDRKGIFEEANQGTLFLDELGELPLDAQVKLLRVVQENKIMRVGSSEERSINVRLIAATHRNLSNEVSEGRFREDLFYRLAIAIIDLPRLTDREGEISLLLDKLLEQVNAEMTSDPSATHKTLSAGARKVAIRHSWPGNVRELLNTLRRVTLWASEEIISAEEMKSALLPRQPPSISGETILGRDLSQPIDIDEIISYVAKHYLTKAMKKSGGNKTKAARILGLNNATTLNNRLKKYNINY